jgi:hypothetical protein
MPVGPFPFTNFNLLFPFPKSQAEAKTGESRKGLGLGNHGSGDTFLGSHSLLEGQNKGEGAQKY